MKRIVILVMMLMMVFGVASAAESTWEQTGENDKLILYLNTSNIKTMQIDGYDIAKATVKHQYKQEYNNIAYSIENVWVNIDIKGFAIVYTEDYDSNGKLLDSMSYKYNGRWNRLPNQYWDKTIEEIIKRAN